MARVTSEDLLAAVTNVVLSLRGDACSSLDLRGIFVSVADLARAELEAELLPSQHTARRQSEERQIKAQLDAIHAQKGTPYSPDASYQ